MELKIGDLIEFQKDKEELRKFYKNHGLDLYVTDFKPSWFSPSLQDKNTHIGIDKLDQLDDYIYHGYWTVIYIPKKDLVGIFPFSLVPEMLAGKNKKLSFLSKISKILKERVNVNTIGKALEKFQSGWIDTIEKQDLKVSFRDQHEIIDHLKKTNARGVSEFRQAHKSLAIDILVKYINEKTFQVLDLIKNNELDKIKASSFYKLDEFMKFMKKELEERKDENLFDYVNKNKYILQYNISPDNEGVMIQNIVLKETHLDPETKLYVTKEVYNKNVEKLVSYQEFFNSDLYKQRKLSIQIDSKIGLFNEIKNLENLNIESIPLQEIFICQKSSQ